MIHEVPAADQSPASFLAASRLTTKPESPLVVFSVKSIKISRWIGLR